MHKSAGVAGPRKGVMGDYNDPPSTTSKIDHFSQKNLNSMRISPKVKVQIDSNPSIA